MSVEWRDICDRCHEVFDFEDDGLTSRHLCLKAEVTDDMLRAAGLRQASLSALRGSVDTSTTAAELLLERRVADPRRMGPFEPGTVPPVVLVADLLAWTRQDIQALPFVGPRSIEKFEAWLARYGHALRRSHDAGLVDRYWRLRDEDADVRRALAGDVLRRRFAELGGSRGERMVGLPEMEIAAGETETIETTILGPFHLLDLIVAARAAFALTVTSIRVGDTELLFGSAPGPSFSSGDILGGEELNAPPLPDGGSVSISVENVSSQAILFRGALRVLLVTEDAVTPGYDRGQPPSHLLNVPLPPHLRAAMSSIDPFRPAPVAPDPFGPPPLVPPPSILPPGFLPPGWDDGER